MDASEVRKFRDPVEKAARRLFSSPDGKIVLDALTEVYGRTLMAKKPLDGSVDADGTLINVGSYNVVEYLRRLAEKEDGES